MFIIWSLVVSVWDEVIFLILLFHSVHSVIKVKFSMASNSFVLDSPELCIVVFSFLHCWFIIHCSFLLFISTDDTLFFIQILCTLLSTLDSAKITIWCSMSNIDHNLCFFPDHSGLWNSLSLGTSIVLYFTQQSSLLISLHNYGWPHTSLNTAITDG